MAGWGFTSLALRPLARLRAGAARVSGAEDLGTALPDDDGPDEVRSLARTLNEMLARLRSSTLAMERALNATRRFAADAGHELRTPLTGMRANLDSLARNPDLPLAERDGLVRDGVAEPFRRGAGATAAGTGLGLAIVAQQVALHGGELRLDESARGGLAVRVELPANGSPQQSEQRKH